MIKLLRSLYRIIKKIKKRVRLFRNSHGKHIFIDRTKGYRYACIVLAGYKDFLWETVFERIIQYTPNSVDVCIVSSGLYDKRLHDICEKNNWSYLSVKRNNLCLAQNLAILKLESAQYFYKLDEDMFITKEFFPCMVETYEKVRKEGRHNIGFVAPLIPINGYGYIQLLNMFNKLDFYEKKFGKAVYTAGNSDLSNFTKNPEIPLFFWGQIEELRNIDKVSRNLHNRSFEYSICPFRFSIGAIFFEKQIWKDMGMFDVNHTTGLALDEIKLCTFCNENSLAVVVSENCLVGHLAYGPQMDAMKDYYEEHIEQFKCHNL